MTLQAQESSAEASELETEAVKALIDVATKVRTKNTMKPWISDGIKELMAERDYAFKVAERSGGEKQKWNNYRKIKNFTNRKVKYAKAEYYKNLINSANGRKTRGRLSILYSEKKVKKQILS